MLTAYGFQRKFESFLDDIEKWEQNGNKAAGARARKLSIEIAKDFAAFRSESVAKDKEAK